MKKERHKITPASYLILVKDNKVLLQRRFNTGYEDGKYSMIAGHVDRGETFTQCIVREAKEEAGIILKPKDLKVSLVMHRDSLKGMEAGENERIDIFFTTENWEGKIENKEPNKCDDLSWFPLDNIPENTIDYVRSAIENYKNKVFYSEFGYSS
jgi:8-oxo-dGTP diphosphatase